MAWSFRCAAPLSRAAAFAAGLALVGGCAPTTPYRYSALTPAVRPLAWDGRAAPGGTLRIDGSVTHANVETDPAPVANKSSALWVPEWTADASLMLAVTSELELGLRGSYAAYQWSNASAVGTVPLPSEPSTWGIGPEVRVAIPLDEKHRFALGFAANILRYSVPYSEWTLTGPGSANGAAQSCAPSSTCVNSQGSYYSFFDERSESHLVYSFGIYPSMTVGEGGKYGHVFALLGGTNGFQNDGFATTPTNGSTVDVIGPVWMIGGGYGYSFEAFHVSAMLFRPFTDSSSAVDYSVGGQITLGVNADLWSSDNSRD
jgi:hypothetical protein